MNLSKSPTPQQLRDLLSSVEDNDHHVICVGHDGEVHLTALQGVTPAFWEEQNKERIRFRLESYQSGNGYVGAGGAKDDRWVGELFETLRDAWEQGKTELVDW